MKIYLVRHTQSRHNVKRRLNADPSVDNSLTRLGIGQAKILAKKLASEKFEVIYVSELPRTKKTAEHINKFHNVPVVTDKRLNENATGFEGRLIDEFLDAFDKSSDPWREKFNDGESLEDARNRAADFLKDLKNKNYSSVLVVTHGFIVESIYGILHNLSYEHAAKLKLARDDYAVFEY